MSLRSASPASFASISCLTRQSIPVLEAGVNADYRDMTLFLLTVLWFWPGIQFSLYFNRQRPSMVH